ncbi:MAG TPA: ParB N-terminal domain-containing protein, partial [Marmoricola sp.]|nr:ParB N-terminal domain-containing protein [Marmoricola sp.]
MSGKQPPRRGLGRGLGSLIPQGPADAEPTDTTNPVIPAQVDTAKPNSDSPAMVAGAYFAEIPVDQIRPNFAQPREVFDEEAMAELVHSIKEVGLLQPVVVRRTDADSFELIMG